jgi:hypothetical protein
MTSLGKDEEGNLLAATGTASPEMNMTTGLEENSRAAAMAH